ncbi:AbiEi antitoxin N-terminal domain-containing protein [Pseudomonas sp. MAFF 301449]|uniref:AbiEi antitoxin N-terminal domain-containing protein n=1 Tax=Pseudomonas cyclaminis TaxID=2781239 RepID=A0ABR9SKY1_9PSED|nr:DUF6088 family protein [Pseudomonas cyclaminis]MBE8589575.1 AbiEi antitoxin N-terminal domain-containing protein [Pseudomonas cyclaminis]MBE8598741.1 AbiEi antitoxin N-terminal domain-containing protein [Pseudomonas cyclaminis]
MSVAKSIAKRIQHMPKGRPFLGSLLTQLGSPASVNKALSRLVENGTLERVARGVYMRPKESKYAGKVRASPLTVMRLMTKAKGETVQIHGSEAVRLLGLSTQMQVLLTFYTSGSTRQIHIGNTTIRLQHASRDRFQHANTKVGIALTAFHYIGKEALSFEVVSHIKQALSEDDLETLQACRMPAWMRTKLTLVSI